MDTKTMEKAGKKGKGVKYRKRFKKKKVKRKKKGDENPDF